MKLLFAALIFSGALLAADTVEVFGGHWSVPNAEDWKVDQEGDASVLHLVVGREPPAGPRRPMQFALLNDGDFHTMRVDVDVKPLERSLIIVFAYRDPAHFDYAHLSTDTGAKQPVHNGIFHVYGGERVRISSEEGPAAFAESKRWYRVHLDFDGSSGRVSVSVDGTPVPALQAVDMSLSSGRVGLGSFDETGDFRDFHILGR